jgi:GTP1/Obg family GTP-binding protein
MKIIIINGKPRSGKDTFVKLLTDIYPYRIKNFSSVDKIKDIVNLCFYWNGEKDNKYRKFISDIKKSWVQFNNGPLNYIIDKINTDIKYCETNKINIKNNIYFIHIREIDEINKLKNFYKENCLTLLINRNEYINKLYNNQSDDYVLNYKYDYIIENSSDINNLKNEIKKFLNKI